MAERDPGHVATGEEMNMLINRQYGLFDVVHFCPLFLYCNVNCCF